MSENVRRIVTAHDAAGKAVVLTDDQVPVADFPGASDWNAKSALIWTTGAVPADNVDDLAGSERSSGATLNGGSVLRVTELGPGFTSAMHRTLSIDYIAVLSGELELELDGGSVVRLQQGDVVIQRGTNHLWRNPSQHTPCRFLASMIEAEPISVAGQVLEQTM
ncbi:MULTISPECIES: cupin domain-containing protein [Streptomyces]|uniref:cupin domain-containing protein n=1 Tax=Streptomyces lycopersici TaxID=2974589 RepID=UPI0021CFF1D6|nr:cupin domain-containing protein [Streptomyces sp. NEAU-383]